MPYITTSMRGRSKSKERDKQRRRVKDGGVIGDRSRGMEKRISRTQLEQVGHYVESDRRSIERQETAERYVRTLRTHYVRNRFYRSEYTNTVSRMQFQFFGRKIGRYLKF